MPIPELTTDRLILRPIRRTDTADIFVYAQDPLVALPGMWDPYASYEACELHVHQLADLYDRGLMWWGLEHRQEGRIVGRVELSDWSRQDARADLSYALSREHWGQGLMSEAVAMAVDYGWNQLKLHRLGATVLPGNEASIRILTKVGMQREGRLRDYRRLAGKWFDVDAYAVLRTPEHLMQRGQSVT